MNNPGYPSNRTQVACRNDRMESQAPQPVVFEPLAEVDHIFDRVAEAAVELDDLDVVGPDLKIDLRAAAGSQQLLGFVHDRATEAAAAMSGLDRQIYLTRP